MSILKVNQIQTANGVIMANLNSSGANIGFQLASTLAPAFSAYQSSSQSLTTSTFTKVLFQTEDFDTNNNFDSSTFTPTVAGYYQISAAVLPSTSTSQTLVSIYKNGTAFKSVTLNGTNLSSTVSSLVYFNGSTDYVEIYAYIVGTTPALTAQVQYTWFNGAMVRSA